VSFTSLAKAIMSQQRAQKDDTKTTKEEVPWSTAFIRAVPGLERVLSGFRKETQPLNKPARSSYFVAFDRERKQGRFANNLDRKLSAKEVEADAREFQHCEQLKTQAIQKGRLVTYMLRAMARSGCAIEPEEFIQCVPCEQGGNFMALTHKDDEGNVNVWICQNTVSGQKLPDMERSITHELIHSFDHCRAHVDLTDCRHHACTEIRAANLSKDCSWWNEWKRGNRSFKDQHKKCVRRRALESLAGNPHCPKDKAEEALDAVWDRCIKDTEPFGSVPW
jgi:inner membrane protease ATP23